MINFGNFWFTQLSKIARAMFSLKILYELELFGVSETIINRNSQYLHILYSRLNFIGTDILDILCIKKIKF